MSEDEASLYSRMWFCFRCFFPCYFPPSTFLISIFGLSLLRVLLPFSWFLSLLLAVYIQLYMCNPTERKNVSSCLVLVMRIFKKKRKKKMRKNVLITYWISIFCQKKRWWRRKMKLLLLLSLFFVFPSPSKFEFPPPPPVCSPIYRAACWGL